jgi:phosphotransferase system HPr (HPr) family protein
MNGEVLRRTITVTNPHGLHMRPLLAFVEAAQRFQAEIWVSKEEGERVSGRSSMNLLTLGVLPNTQVVLEAQGPDAARALEELAEILLTIPPEDA